MKILNKNKIIVSALALAIGASLAGSISGTVAWYQYSTRANVSFIGKAGGVSGNLQMRFKGENDSKWRTRITSDEINANIAANDFATSIVPMTYGAMDKDAALPTTGYVQPAYGIADMTKWAKATKANYAQFELELRYNERDGIKENDVDEKNIAKDVYLSKLLIQEDYTNHEAPNDKKDLSEAVRVHFHTYPSLNESNPTAVIDRLVSKNGGTVLTGSKLDLDGDGAIDKAFSGTDEGAEFGFGSGTTENPIIYGGGVQTSYSNKTTVAAGTYSDIDDQQQAEEVYPAVAGTDGNILTDLKYAEGNQQKDKLIGKVVEGTAEVLRVKVTIWVEGWQKLSDHADPTPNYSAIWDAEDYINSSFDIGIQFAVQDAYAE